MVEPSQLPEDQSAPSAEARPSPPLPSGEAAGGRSKGERVRRKRRESKKRSTGSTPIGPAISRWTAGILGVVALAFVLVMRFWWVVPVVFGVVLLLGAIYRARSKKKRRPVPWVKLAIIGGVSASIATIGPVIALRAGGGAAEREDVGLPGSIEATLGTLQLLVVDFVLATIGVVLLAMALASRLRSRHATDD